MIRSFAVLLAFVCTVAPVWAEGRAVRDRSQFLTLVKDRELRIGLYDLTLRVLADGRIEGSALGRKVEGVWAWKDGYFCRQMIWGSRDIPYNCQLVEVEEDGAMRFTVDQGRGMSAAFRLR
jgi:hypothetical protein